MRSYDAQSRVEERALARSGRPLSYAPVEKVGVVEVPDFPSLGRLAALRFLEWLQRNPEGVISLPTGKTPEPFIRWTTRLLADWDKPEAQKILGDAGLDPGVRPRMDGYTFVQIDEFYPLDPAQENSFAHYIRRYYLGEFGLDEKKALLLDAWRAGAPPGRDLGAVFPDGAVDLTLRYRAPRTEAERLQVEAITAADEMAQAYEARLRELGGIGFFLGGIGPDGHIGFNIRGSDHFSVTRLAPINYETAAAAAGDLGGIETARRKAVVTIGLHTLTHNPTATLLIIAAGEAKAGVVRDAVEEAPTVRYPATALQACPGTRFYLTRGATVRLVERRCAEWRKTLPPFAAERILVDVACRRRKRLSAVTPEDGKGDRLAALLPSDPAAHAQLAAQTEAALKERVARGMAARPQTVFLHTAPHHDDIMLGYLPYLVHLVREPSSTHYFATLTSGFTAVTNAYLAGQLENLTAHFGRGTLETLWNEGYFARSHASGRDRDIFHYLDGIAANSREMQAEAEARRLVRDMAELTSATSLEHLRQGVTALRSYLSTRYPGQKDTPQVQTLKGMVREWEEELLWAHLGFSSAQIFHLRLGFYTGDLFTPPPTMERDVQPILELLEKLRPGVVTVALDPEGAGPDTHYKVLQAIAEALRLYAGKHPDRRPLVWGYRNIWHRFHPAEANLYVPVSLNSLAILKSAFHICFGSQRSASFPSYEYDGPFCDLAQRILVEQYAMMKTCLGREFFHQHPVARLRATRGMNFLREMTPDEFFQEARELRKATES
jgi:glucosamine-6-phosphate deaminase